VKPEWKAISGIVHHLSYFLQPRKFSVCSRGHEGPGPFSSPLPFEIHSGPFRLPTRPPNHGNCYARYLTGDTRHDPHSCWCFTHVSRVRRLDCHGHLCRTEMAGKVVVPAAARVRGTAGLTAINLSEAALVYPPHSFFDIQHRRGAVV
jgi:hypothetical protein